MSHLYDPENQVHFHKLNNIFEHFPFGYKEESKQQGFSVCDLLHSFWLFHGGLRHTPRWWLRDGTLAPK